MLTKHAFGVCAVRYASQYIESVRDEEDAAAISVNISLNTLLACMHSGSTIVTLCQRFDGKWDH
jgi:hypothetical protein